MSTESVGLCLSGGGYRAMLFHTGALWRLNELGVLSRLDVISSVSGGSITAGALAKAWPELEFSDGVATNFVPAVVDPLRRLANRNIDVRVILRGLLLPGRSIGDEVIAVLRNHLFGDRRMSELPESPQFVFNATNLQNGELWWFYRDKEPPTAAGEPILLATAVAASSAFPPFLSPVKVPTSASERESGLPEEAVLSDAGVFDNLGLDPVVPRCDTVLVSDAGQKFDFQPRVKRNWALHLLRVLDVIDNQVRSLRKRGLVECYVEGEAAGAYWAAHSDIDDFEMPDTLPAPKAKSDQLAAVPTRLHRLDADLQRGLINWGYAVTDAALRKHVVTTAEPPTGYPYPESPLD
ncbi:patatin-like phospholipase family protein [Amycolatopsis magusensis]|uniref:patatin-like phospholipase family protein n=1 Tax=Amycolatopsis magusensis TaxID=882444 RepID=UPI0037B1C2E6